MPNGLALPPPVQDDEAGRERRREECCLRRVTHMDREESVPLDGAWNMHWRVCGSRGGSRHCSRLAAWRSRPRLGEGDSTPIRLGGRLLDIHDLVPQLEEALRFERLREEVGEVLVAADKRNTDLGFFDGLADEEVTPLDVFEPAVVLGVVGRGNGGLVVTVLLGGRGLGGG